MKIGDYLPKISPEELVAVQGYVSSDLRQDVIKQMQRDKKAGIKINWNVLLEAVLKSYLDERKRAS